MKPHGEPFFLQGKNLRGAVALPPFLVLLEMKSSSLIKEEPLGVLTGSSHPRMLSSPYCRFHVRSAN
jgi:hypothetical protein